METFKSISDQVIDKIKKAHIELEEFQLQLALGKADAKDTYEEVKNKFHLLIDKLRLYVSEIIDQEEIKTYLDELQVQLSLGKAETFEAYTEQKKMLSKALHNLETSILDIQIPLDVKSTFQLEFEKFKIKLEILKLVFELGKLDVKEKYEENKNNFIKKLEQIKLKISEEITTATNRADNFQQEIKEAYSHLKKAFTQNHV